MWGGAQQESLIVKSVILFTRSIWELGVVWVRREGPAGWGGRTPVLTSSTVHHDVVILVLRAEGVGQWAQGAVQCPPSQSNYAMLSCTSFQSHIQKPQANIVPCDQ